MEQETCCWNWTLRQDAAQTPRSKAPGAGTLLPPARLGKGTAKERLEPCVTPAFVIVLEIRVSDVRGEVISVVQGWLLGTRRGRLVGRAAGGFVGSFIWVCGTGSCGFPRRDGGKRLS